MSKKVSNQKSVKNNERYQISIFLEPKDVEEVKAISIAKETGFGAVIVDLMREGLQKEEYKKIFQAYQQFKDTVG